VSGSPLTCSLNRCLASGPARKGGIFPSRDRARVCEPLDCRSRPIGRRGCLTPPKILHHLAWQPSPNSPSQCVRMECHHMRVSMHVVCRNGAPQRPRSHMAGSARKRPSDIRRPGLGQARGCSRRHKLPSPARARQGPGKGQARDRQGQARPGKARPGQARDRQGRGRARREGWTQRLCQSSHSSPRNPLGAVTPPCSGSGVLGRRADTFRARRVPCPGCAVGYLQRYWYGLRSRRCRELSPWAEAGSLPLAECVRHADQGERLRFDRSGKIRDACVYVYVESNRRACRLPAESTMLDHWHFARPTTVDEYPSGTQPGRDGRGNHPTICSRVAC
jgi:hypothetical protein